MSSFRDPRGALSRMTGQQAPYRARTDQRKASACTRHCRSGCAILLLSLSRSRLEQATMSQSSLPRLGFIGAGRLARCLALSFSRAGYPVTAVASRTAASASRLAIQIEYCAAFDDPQQVVDAADIIFLAVPDDSIGTTAHTLRFTADAGKRPTRQGARALQRRLTGRIAGAGTRPGRLDRRLSPTVPL